MKIKIIKENFEKAMNEMTKDYSSIGREGAARAFYEVVPQEKAPKTPLEAVKFIEDAVQHLYDLFVDRLPPGEEESFQVGNEYSAIQQIRKELKYLASQHSVTPMDVEVMRDPSFVPEIGKERT
tara:strand:+ start:643 stop:1014 length:372 start_codon:yes stop_codon:yes gene_type:complete